MRAGCSTDTVKLYIDFHIPVNYMLWQQSVNVTKLLWAYSTRNLHVIQGYPNTKSASTI